VVEKKNKQRFITNDDPVLDDDVLDGDMDELDEETDKAHDSETESGGQCNLLELCFEEERNECDYIKIEYMEYKK
jgi:hypothetical protein